MERFKTRDWLDSNLNSFRPEMAHGLHGFSELSGHMRVRITKQPPPSYGFDADSLLAGRVYNLDASLAAALMVDGCAESYDLLSSAEKRDFRSRKPATLWKAANRSRLKDWGDPDPTA